MDVALYDTTLREGAQGASTDFTLADRERIFALLCDMEVPYIEAGNPASNPADAEFFRRVTSPKRAKLAAFGATCRVGADPAADTGLAALLLAGTPVITIFGKSWDYHVDEVLRTSRGENLRMIEETVRYLTSHGREVHFDAEHFFDGYRANRDYALEVLRAAVRGGATWLCLCDTNGGTFPDAVERTVFDVLRDISLPVAIHAHNDTGMAEANAVAAVSAGVKMVQCTLAGAGERCGNTNLFTAAPNLQLKMGLSCLPEGVMSRLASFASRFADIANQRKNPRAPYVGSYAFAHKSGMHIDAVTKAPKSFEHVAPELVGGERRFLLSEVAGGAAVYHRVKRLLPDVTRHSPVIQTILDTLKQKEFEGYRYEAADASFDLLVKNADGRYTPHFQLLNFHVTVSEPSQDERVSSAVVHISVDGQPHIGFGIGNGPVNALDGAARNALSQVFPTIQTVSLTDYKVRVLDGGGATASNVRVLIESTDGEREWVTVGVSADVVKASWTALSDSFEYKLYLDDETRTK